MLVFVYYINSVMTSRIIRKHRFFLGYVLALIGAYSLDCLTTYYALSQGLGWEVNPLVNTTNFFTIFFDPIAMLLFGVTITIVYLAEKKRRNEINSNSVIGKLWTTVRGSKVIFILLILSFYPIFGNIFAAINNTMVIFGLPSPVGEFTRLLPYYSDYHSLSLFGSLTVFYIIEALIFVRVVWIPIDRRYKTGVGKFFWFRKPKQS